jgi:glycosyltransferase involved in cell wall biosynthesis
MEGSSNVLSEALASGVPVICSKIPGLLGTLGSSYPGVFPVGNTRQLTALLMKAETDCRFYTSLWRHCARPSYLGRPMRERSGRRELLHELRL